jgi:hypothetical protein
VTTPDKRPQVLFYECGASWAWVLAGPGSGIAMALIQMSAGYGLQPLVPLVFLVLVSLFVAIQVKATRIHMSVELTRETLRQGVEVTRISDIVHVYPPAARSEAPKWQSARSLGELNGVPRGRTGIGLKLTNDRTAQAWARRHAALRAALTPLVEERVP